MSNPEVSASPAPAPEPALDLSKIFREEPDLPAVQTSAAESAEPAPASPDAEAADSTVAAEPIPAEKAKESAPAPTPEQERAAARIAVARKAELRAARQRAELEAREREIAKREEALKTRESGLSDLRAKAREKPTEALKELGFDAPEDFLRRVIAEGTPEAAARAKAELAERKAAELETKFATLQRAWEERQAREAEQSRAQAAQAASNVFLDMVSENAEKYPTLVEEYTPEEITAQAWAIAQKHGATYTAETGDEFTDEIIAEHLEEQARARAIARDAWRQRVKGAKASEAPSESETPAAVQRPKVRAVTAKQAAPKPPAKRPQTQEEIDAWSIEVLSKAFRDV